MYTPCYTCSLSWSECVGVMNVRIKGYVESEKLLEFLLLIGQGQVSYVADAPGSSLLEYLVCRTHHV